jgi:hypothetical protein
MLYALRVSGAGADRFRSSHVLRSAAILNRASMSASVRAWSVTEGKATRHGEDDTFGMDIHVVEAFLAESAVAGGNNDQVGQGFSEPEASSLSLRH